MQATRLWSREARKRERKLEALRRVKVTFARGCTTWIKGLHFPYRLLSLRYKHGGYSRVVEFYRRNFLEVLQAGKSAD